MTFHVDLPVLGPVPEGSTREEAVAHIAEAARLIRRKDLTMVANARLGHLGGEFSVTDVLTTLYLGVMNHGEEGARSPGRDILILSKGHTAVALYCTLAMTGLLPVEDLETFAQPKSQLNGHPARTKVRAVEANTGPLGHGLPIGVGAAIAAKIDGSEQRVFVITGDGELQEGSNWEAMMSASQYGLDNLCLIVDRNHLQQGATTEDTNDLSPLADKAAAFGWKVAEVDGHDHGALLDLFTDLPQEEGRPTFVIANTHKGYPISFMTDQIPWHHRLPTDDEVRQALSELEVK